MKSPRACSWLEVIICTKKKMIRNRMIRTLFCENNTHMGFYVFYILYISYLLFFIVNPCISIIQTLYYISYTFRLNTSECSSAFFTNYLAVLVNFLFILYIYFEQNWWRILLYLQLGINLVRVNGQTKLFKLPFLVISFGIF